MKFDKLEDRMLYFRGLTDYRLCPNSYVLVMLDGRSFSKLIKNAYKKPFDEIFVNMMNEVAAYLLKKVGNCKFAYTQSDEITLVLTDFDTETTDSFFGYRLSKILSIVASLASAKFNHLVTLNLLNQSDTIEVAKELINNMKLAEFDCKAWNVPSFNDVYAWILYRQNDCIRNSKQQTAQTFLPHSDLLNKKADEQIALLLKTKNINWNEFDNGVKFGRFIFKTVENNRSVINIESFSLKDYGRDNFIKRGLIPKLE